MKQINFIKEVDTLCDIIEEDLRDVLDPSLQTLMEKQLTFLGILQILSRDNDPHITNSDFGFRLTLRLEELKPMISAPTYYGLIEILKRKVIEVNYEKAKASLASKDLSLSFFLIHRE